MAQKLRLTENSEMPIGKAHKGKKLSDVPASHLLWWWEETNLQDMMRVGLYIEQNYEALLAERAQNDKKYNR